jgi:hypothetical protein
LCGLIVRLATKFAHQVDLTWDFHGF